MSGTWTLLALHYPYSGSITAVIIALQHFKKVIPVRYPFTPPPWSVANVYHCLIQKILVLPQGFEPRIYCFTVLIYIHWTRTPLRNVLK